MLEELCVQVRQTLETWADGSSSERGQLLGSAIDACDKVSGSLAVINFESGELMAQGMRDALARLDQDSSQNDIVQIVLEATAILPDYLDYAESTESDPIGLILPMVNDLRVAAGKPALDKAEFFPVILAGVRPPEELNDGKIGFSALRRDLQLALRDYLTQRSEAGLEALKQAVLGVCHHPLLPNGVRRMAWALGGLTELIQAGSHGFSADVSRHFSRLDSLLKEVCGEADEIAVGDRADSAVRAVLYLVATAEVDTPLCRQLREAFDFESALAESSRSGSIFLAGHSSDLFRAVTLAAREDLARIKDTLGSQLENDRDPAIMDQQIELLRSVGESLSMIGLHGLGERIANQAENLKDVGPDADDPVLVQVARELIVVESSLSDGFAASASESLSTSPDDDNVPGTLLPKSEYKRILRQLWRECNEDLAHVKHLLDAVSRGQSDADGPAEAKTILSRISDALKMAQAENAASLLDAASRIVESDLIEASGEHSAANMAALAETLTAIEFHLEEMIRSPSAEPAEAILRARQHLLALGFLDKPQPDLEATEAEAEPTAEPLSELTEALDRDDTEPDQASPADEPASTPEDGPGLAQPGPSSEDESSEMETLTRPETSDELEQELSQWLMDDSESFLSEEQISIDPIAEIDASARGNLLSGDEPSFAEGVETNEDSPLEATPPEQPSEAGDEIGRTATADDDFDLLEIFLEEFDQEHESLCQSVPAWASKRDNQDVLRNIRRSFHSLKGSGRMAGAVEVGEFSWQFEELLNHVLEGRTKASDELVELVAEGVRALPSLRARLVGSDSAELDADACQDLADRAGDFLAPPPAIEERAWPPEMAELDATLVDLMIKELSDHLEVLSDWVADSQSRDVPGHIGSNLVRAVHTMKGTMRLAPIADECETAQFLESYLDELALCDSPPSLEGQQAIEQCLALFEARLARLELKDVPDQSFRTTDLAQRLAHLQEQAHRKRTGEMESGDAEPAAAEDSPAASDADPFAALQLGPDEFMQADDASEVFRIAEEPRPPLSDERSVQDEGAAAEERIERPDELAPERDFDAEPETAPQLEAESPEFVEPSLFDAPLELDQAPDPGSDTAQELDQYPGASDTAEPQPEADLESDFERDLETEQEPEPTGAQEAEGELTESIEDPLDLALDQELETEQESEQESELDAEPEFSPDQEPDFEPELEPELGFAPEPDAESDFEPEPEQQRGDDVEPQPALVSGEPDAPPREAEQSTKPETQAIDYDSLNADLLEAFLEEALELLEDSDGLLHKWHEAPTEKGIVFALQRNLHTLKGASRMVGLNPIGQIAHAMEELLESIAAGVRTASEGRINAIEAGCDHLNDMIEAVLNRQTLPIKTLDDLFAEQVTELETSAALAAVETLEETTTDGDAGATHRVDTLRVRADLIDDLVNQAGEVSIYRSRLDQRLSQLRANITEVDETVLRLRNQLRKLELETEAQILARFEREHGPGQSDFDPLELDRYSTLQQLSRALAESVNDLTSLSGLLDEGARQSESLLLQQSRVNTELQEGLMLARMVSFRTLLPRFRRVIRNSARELGRRVDLDVVLEGEGELDRNVLDRMTAPIEHLLRNSISHGIEPPELREKLGKDPTGRIVIDVRREATELVIRVGDDGQGLDLDKIRQRALARGLIDEDEPLRDQDLTQLIFVSGLSTSEQVSELAGRGIGMNVVSDTVRQIGGSILIDSKPGQGLTFIIRLPLSLTVLQAIHARVSDRVFAIPLQVIRGVVRLPVSDWLEQLQAEKPAQNYAGGRFPLLELEPQLDFEIEEPQGGTVNLLMVEIGDQRAALKVPELLGHREIVIKPVGPQISSITGILGATVSSDGQVVPILDMGPLIRRAFARGLVPGSETVDAETDQPEAKRTPLILVVDDSITVRRVTSRVLEQNGFEVLTARDGLDAVESLVDRVPDLILLDIEMPRMDGYELASHVRNDRRLKHIPMIMITSRSGDKHRQRASELGVNDYMSKPYHENDLVARVFAQLERAEAPISHE